MFVVLGVLFVNDSLDVGFESGRFWGEAVRRRNFWRSMYRARSARRNH